MTYKGYSGSVHYCDEDRVFYGQVEYIRSLISYEGEDVDALRRAFEEAVDDYLDLCKQAGENLSNHFPGRSTCAPVLTSTAVPHCSPRNSARP